jgi:hypothetical protein
MGRGSSPSLNDVVRSGFEGAWDNLGEKEMLLGTLLSLTSLLEGAGPLDKEKVISALEKLWTLISSSDIDISALDKTDAFLEALLGYRLTLYGERSRNGVEAFLPRLFFTLRAADAHTPLFVKEDIPGISQRYHARKTAISMTTLCGKKINPRSWEMRGLRGIFHDNNLSCDQCHEANPANPPYPLAAAMSEGYGSLIGFEEEFKAVKANGIEKGRELLSSIASQGPDALASYSSEKVSKSKSAAFFASTLIETMEKAAVKEGCYLAAKKLDEMPLQERAAWVFSGELYSARTDSYLGPLLLEEIEKTGGLDQWPPWEVVAECFEMAAGNSPDLPWTGYAGVELRAMAAIAATRWPQAVNEVYCKGEIPPTVVSFLAENFNPLIPQAKAELHRRVKASVPPSTA